MSYLQILSKYVVLEEPADALGRKNMVTVHQNWVDKTKKLFFWPPDATDRKIADMIGDNATPDSSWKILPYSDIMFTNSKY